MIENSPEKKGNTLKRHALEELGNTPTKLMKSNEGHKVSKARVALFQDKNYESKLKNITLSTTNFYSNSESKRNYNVTFDLAKQKQQKKYLIRRTINNIRRHSGGSIKIGGINAGVSHGIKKPKPRSSLDNAKNNNSNEQMIISKQDAISEVNEINESDVLAIEDRSSSPEIDLNKRFFKIKRASKRNSMALITINKNVKLKIAADGKLALNEMNAKRSHKRAKLADISFDTNDLSVDEPDLEATMKENNMANILQMLEDDWADNDYDTMTPLTSDKLKHITPLEPVAILNNVVMSPMSNLSNLTSAIDIKDSNSPAMVENSSFDSNEKNDDEDTPNQKCYPLFDKNYSSTANKVFNEKAKKSTHSTKENINWQLSVKLNGGDNQYLLDAGQKKFGATQCMECGIVYQIGDPEDENAHLNYHNNKKTLKFPGWKTERIIMEDSFTSSRVILVEPGDSKLYWKKVMEVLAYVDRDLGLVDSNLTDYEQKQVYLYVRNKVIIGVLVAEQITTAHRMIPELLELDCCTVESSPAKCGINVIWTDLNHRRQGIATKLLDILRAQFYFGYVMSLDDIAFSVPTPSGKVFAEKYTKTRNFKVYS
ncbi:establishment of cohesion [Xylocopa sonorina]|uniref:establishment of cohesion n=1 Tax=Xylocopa sonorina TaxID=1818115 RepID=UPI00403AABE9